MAIGIAQKASLMPDPVNAEPYGREGLPLEQARAQILEALQPLGLEETLPLTQALGRTTATPVCAAASVPARSDRVDDTAQMISK